MGTFLFSSSFSSRVDISLLLAALCVVQQQRLPSHHFSPVIIVFFVRRPGTETTTTRRPRAQGERQDRPAGGTRHTAETTAANRVRCWVFIYTYIISFPHSHPRVEKKDSLELKRTSEIQHSRPRCCGVLLQV